jgi:hypothetical protein
MRIYLRITRAHFNPSRYEELQAVVPDVSAAIWLLPGFQSMQTGFDRANGKSVSVTTFDTLEHAQFQRSSLDAVFATLQASSWQGEAPEIYDLTT